MTETESAWQRYFAAPELERRAYGHANSPAYLRLQSELRSVRTGLHISGPRNTTKFTNCCGLAVHSEAQCPGCRATIFR